MLKKLLITFEVLLLLVALAALGAGGYAGWLFYRAMPDYAGNAAMPGLSAPVNIVRDEHGVPHIFAANMDDAARALGYVHASERLFQMETQRRAGQGRLSEIFGPDTVGIDKFVRTLGLYRLAQSSVGYLSPEAQKFFQAYADGVNAWLDTHRDALPPEFLILGVKPEPWQIADSLVWGKLMALQLSKNYPSEILRAQLMKKLNAAQMGALFPAAPASAPVTTEPEGGPQPDTTPPATTSPNAPQPDTPKPDTPKPGAQNSSDFIERIGAITSLDHPASNEWVIAGSRTQSGKPILANDPHLGLEAPILWYLARIVTPDLAIEGGTVPGLPVVLLGQNDHVAWGFTTTGSDVQDLFIETVDPKNPDYYLTPDGNARFEVRTETIRVKGAAKDVVIQVRTTRHGPVLSDVDAELTKLMDIHKVASLAFTALGGHDTTSEALMRINRAKNAQEFLESLRLYQAPPQNVVYADTDGDIGFINPGYVPVRKAGDGTVPVDGASGAYDWVSLIPFAQLPQTLNPKAGFVFNANNAIVGPKFPYFMGVDWEEPWRSYRLQQFFDAIKTHTPETSAMMQADHLSLAAFTLLPRLLAQKPTDTTATQALDMLRGWDGVMDKDRPEPLIFDAWLYEMHRHLLVEKTGSPLAEQGPYAATSIAAILDHDANDWCAAPDCGDVIVKSFNDAINLLIARDGPDMQKWRWGDEHVTVLRHKFYSHIPILRDWSKLDIASSGDFYTLDRGGSATVDPDHPFARTHGGGYRGIYDLSNPTQSRFMIATGESGHIFSHHYGDLTPLWNNVQSFTLTGTRDELMAKGLPELVLNPATQ